MQLTRLSSTFQSENEATAKDTAENYSSIGVDRLVAGIDGCGIEGYVQKMDAANANEIEKTVANENGRESATLEVALLVLLHGYSFPDQ